VKNLAAGSYATMIINGGPGGCNAIQTGDVGLSVKDMPSGGLKFGLDVGGGITNIYAPTNYSKPTMEGIVDAVKKRIESTGSRDTKVYSFEGSDKKTYLKFSGITDEIFEVLTIPGKFEAKISQNVEIKDGNGKFVVGDQTHSVTYSDGISIDGVKRNIEEGFLLNDIKFYLANFTNTSATLDALFFSNNDVLNVYTTSSYVSFLSSMGQYEFYIPVEFTNAAANRFANLTKRMNTKIVGSNNILLDGNLVYSLDGKIISTLPISFESAGKVINTMAVIGFDKSAKFANSEMRKIEIVLKSGGLAASLKLVGSERYIGDFEYAAKNYLPFVAIAAVLVVIVLGRIKCGSWKGSLYSTVLSLAEIIFVFGLISAVQKIGYSWIVDAETIVGLFAIVFIGYVDSHFRINKKQKIIVRLCVFTAAFITLFTPWRGFGMVLIAAIILKTVLTDGMRTKLAEKSASKT
jgi:hypothetical protein